MTDRECLEIEIKCINHLMRCKLNDFSISCQEMGNAFNAFTKASRGLKK